MAQLCSASRCKGSLSLISRWTLQGSADLLFLLILMEKTLYCVRGIIMRLLLKPTKQGNKYSLMTVDFSVT